MFLFVGIGLVVLLIACVWLVVYAVPLKDHHRPWDGDRS